ncbi:MAG: bifunctional hydroxymethylpyrimidine kinase/phosphomethylpyrimidine kinase [Geminicoccaceae bacterium]|nr:bifunctional hydroxymethylpyrimidine kinase/phosphomethylpyrimidine kinase [Geminicoccaceae bacterium]
MTTPRALTIAGSDSGGGAGIQADLKTFAALGVHGSSAITALTAQNTCGVHGIHDVPAAFVAAQIDAVMEDIGADAVKIGMLGRPEVIETVAERLAHWRPRRVVLDPVMVAKGGDKLLRDEAISALRACLLPSASIVTPNLPEAAVLLNEPAARDRPGMVETARRLSTLGPMAVLLKGGHLEGEESPDLLLHEGREVWFEGVRHATRNTHGTGCTLSSAIAAHLARGMALEPAIAAAKSWLEAAIGAADALAIGRGHGPVHHFHGIWRNSENPS